MFQRDLSEFRLQLFLQLQVFKSLTLVSKHTCLHCVEVYLFDQ